jgi:hypothetical protein
MIDTLPAWREHTFLSNPRTSPEFAASRTRLRVGGNATGGDAASRAHLRVGGTASGDSANGAMKGGATGGDAANGADLWLQAGATFGEAEKALRSVPSRVLQIDVSDLSLLCRCVADLPAVHQLNQKLPAALGLPYHYCDTTDNPYFVDCKAAGRQGCRKHPFYLMNVSRGMQRPPAIPSRGCGVQAAAGEPRCAEMELPREYINEGVHARPIA